VPAIFFKLSAFGYISHNIRYPLFIGTIDKHTPAGHPDKAIIHTAMETCTAIVAHINERVRRAELQGELRALYDRLVVPPKLQRFSLPMTGLQLVRSMAFRKVKFLRGRRQGLLVARISPRKQRRLSLLLTSDERYFMMITKVSVVH
jgi:hypothetical protein